MGSEHPSTPLVDELGKAYAQADTELQILIRDAILSGRLDEAHYLAGIRASVIQVLARLHGKAVPLMNEAVRRAYVYESNTTLAKVMRFFGKITLKDGLPLDQQIKNARPINQRAVQLLVENATKKVEEVNTLIGRQVDGVLRKTALDAATQSVLQGEGMPDAAKRLQHALTKAGVTMDGEKGRYLRIGSRNYSLEPYSKMVARTLTREAASHATANRLVGNGLDLVTVTRHEGGDDDLCGPYEGNTYSLTGNTPGYPMLDQYPPFHPNCRHVLTPAKIIPAE